MTRALLPWVFGLSTVCCVADPDPGRPCPNDLPDACPAVTPSYTADVAPVVERRCFPCHAPGGTEAAKHDYSTYAGVFADRGPILNQVYACKMPPDDAHDLGVDERKVLLEWLVCEAPDN